MVQKMTVLILIFASILLGVIGQLSMKKGMLNVGEISVTELFGKKLFSVVFEKFVFIGIALYITSAAFWLVILSQEELSFAYPLIGIGYIVTAILAKIFFHESLTMFKILGIILIVVGAFFVVARW
jgi:multidrug transporter EmrE-like cation transporter